MRDYVLGLDLGTASIGWAIIDLELDDDGEIGSEIGLRAAGVRIFPEGVNRGPKGAEKPKNVERRTARGARRNRYRFHQRRRNLARILVAAGLLPESEADRQKLWRLDPYVLRARGLDEDLSAHEFGRALFHLNQRRGFKSNRKSGEANANKGMLKEISDLADAIKESKARTLGEYLNEIAGTDRSCLVRGETHLRKRHTLRAMYQDEFDLLWGRQVKAHPETLTDELRQRVADEIIFFQRPLRLQTHLIGQCEHEPQEKRGPKSHWVSQQYRVLCDVANLMIQQANGHERKLSEHERAQATQLLSANDKRTFKQLHKALGLDPDARFNLEQGGRTSIGGNSAEAALLNGIGEKQWLSLTAEAQAHLRELLTECEDEDEMRSNLAEFELKPDAEIKLIAYAGPDGYGHLSLKAMRNLIPHLEAGLNLHEAKKACDYVQIPVVPVETRLPAPPNIRNPVVQSALVEVRKVVNELIRIHGLPYRIVVELAREMKGSVAEREEKSIEMHKRQVEREEVARKLEEEVGIPVPRRADIEKYRLWEDQEGICPYSGRAISQGQLFSSDIEVDHILPRWRSLDDSYLNKVVAFTQSNREKADRTPREWREGLGDYDGMIERISKMKGMPFSKRRKFTQKEIDLDSFVARQLNDTRYLSVAARDYLGCLFEPEDQASRVRVGRGQLTAELRRRWGLNSLLTPFSVQEGEEPPKYRGDHRHHAIDAIVVALSRPGHLKRLAAYHKQKNRMGTRAPAFEEPWEEFRSSVASVIQLILVSHRPRRRLRGPLHEGFFYGPSETQGEYFYRKSVSELTAAMIPKIRDKAVREAVEARLSEFGWQEGKAIPKGSLDDPENPVRMLKGNVPILRVRIRKQIGDPVEFTREGDQTPFRAAISGNNHHAEFLAHTGAGSNGIARVEVVSMIEGARRARRGHEPIIGRKHPDGLQTAYALSIGDSVLIQHPAASQSLLCVIKNMSPTPRFIDICLRDARDARPAGKSKDLYRIVSLKRWNELNVQKVQVSPCGLVHRSGI